VTGLLVNREGVDDLKNSVAIYCSEGAVSLA